MIKSGNSSIALYKKAILILFVAVFMSGIMACSGNKNNTDLNTPEGVVNSFVKHILEEGDLLAAYDLLTEADRAAITQNEMARKYITGESDSLVAKYKDFYQQMIPDILAVANKLVKIHARSPKIRDDFTEIGLEISYPSDYMTLYFAGMSLISNVSNKMDNRKFEELSSEEQEKLLWSIKNDFKKTVDNLQIDKYSTYIFPLKVVEEDGNWRINLELGSIGDKFSF